MKWFSFILFLTIVGIVFAAHVSDGVHKLAGKIHISTNANSLLSKENFALHRIAADMIDDAENGTNEDEDTEAFELIIDAMSSEKTDSNSGTSTKARDQWKSIQNFTMTLQTLQDSKNRSEKSKKDAAQNHWEKIKMSTKVTGALQAGVLKKPGENKKNKHLSNARKLLRTVDGHYKGQRESPAERNNQNFKYDALCLFQISMTYCGAD